jgi:hypothetical protein
VSVGIDSEKLGKFTKFQFFHEKHTFMRMFVCELNQIYGVEGKFPLCLRTSPGRHVRVVSLNLSVVGEVSGDMYVLAASLPACACWELNTGCRALGHVYISRITQFR